jgi:hypothetical protein
VEGAEVSTKDSWPRTVIYEVEGVGLTDVHMHTSLHVGVDIFDLQNE